MIHGDLSPEASFSIGAEPVFPKATGTKMEPGETVEWFMRKHMAGPSLSPRHSRGLERLLFIVSERGGHWPVRVEVIRSWLLMRGNTFSAAALSPERLGRRCWLGGALETLARLLP